MIKIQNYFLHILLSFKEELLTVNIFASSADRQLEGEAQRLDIAASSKEDFTISVNFK